MNERMHFSIFKTLLPCFIVLESVPIIGPSCEPIFFPYHWEQIPPCLLTSQPKTANSRHKVFSFSNLLKYKQPIRMCPVLHLIFVHREFNCNVKIRFILH